MQKSMLLFFSFFFWGEDRGDKGDIEGKRKMADMVDRAVSSKKVLKVYSFKN